MTGGALIGAVVALIAWLGLWAYLLLLQARLDAAQAALGRDTPVEATGVTITEVNSDGE